MKLSIIFFGLNIEFNLLAVVSYPAAKNRIACAIISEFVKVFFNLPLSFCSFEALSD